MKEPDLPPVEAPTPRGPAGYAARGTAPGGGGASRTAEGDLAVMGRDELRSAASTAIAFGLVVIGLLVVLAVLPDADDRPSAATVALFSGLIAGWMGGLLLLDGRRRLTVQRLLGFQLAAVPVLASLVAVTSGFDSIFASLYVPLVLHAAIYQPARGSLLVLGLAILAFLAPTVYDDVDSNWLALCVAVIPPVAIASLVVNSGSRAQRRSRSQLASRADEAARLAEIDPLTGLGNYRKLWTSLEVESARAARHKEPFSLVLLDLDGFKQVNDVIGHQEGDRVLRNVAAALTGALRGEDVCCRQGGDEFAVIAVGAGEEEAADVAARLRGAVATVTVEFGASGQLHRLGVGTGVATFTSEVRGLSDLMARADADLRSSKRRRPAAEPLPGTRRSDDRDSAAADLRFPDEPPAVFEEKAPAADEEFDLPRWDDAPRAARLTEPDRRADDRRSSSAPPPADTARRTSDSGPEIPREELAALAGLARALAGARTERAVAESTAAHLAGAIDADGVVILLDRDGVLTPVAAAGPAASVVGADAHIGRRAVRSALATGRTSLHAADDGDEVAVPLRAGDITYGCLLCTSDPRGGFGPSDSRLADAMGAQAAQALACVDAFAALEALPPDQAGDAAGAFEASAGESERVARLARRAGARLGLAGSELRSLHLAALFHGVGSMGVPAAVVGKAGLLSTAERDSLRQRPLIAERLMRSLPILAEAAPIVLHQHERYDGSGHPDGLARDEIPLASRILAASAAWVAMTSPRPWRAALSPEVAREELEGMAGTELDPRVVRTVIAARDRGE